MRDVSPEIFPKAESGKAREGGVIERDRARKIAAASPALVLSAPLAIEGPLNIDQAPPPRDCANQAHTSSGSAFDAIKGGMWESSDDDYGSEEQENERSQGSRRTTAGLSNFWSVQVLWP